MEAAAPPRTRDRISKAYERLRELIVTGRLAPGSRIIESDVAERLSTSRTPVRGALQRLLQEGYVVAAGGRKRRMLSVAPLTREDGRELFWVVGELEGVAAHWVAELPAEDRGAVTEKLRSINRGLLDAAGEQPPDPRPSSTSTRASISPASRRAAARASRQCIGP
jgi:DNA-binding GntR family transcriptional regulator